MSFAAALQAGDPALLPSRRDESWRWTDLRGLLRRLPPAAPTRLERIIVPAGERRSVELSFAGASGEAQLARVDIEIAAGGELDLIERYAGEADGLASIEIGARVGEGAILRRLAIADDGPGVVSVSTAAIALAPAARLEQTTLAAGARRQRLETRVAHAGGGAAARLDGLYLLTGQSHADLTTVVEHAGGGGESEQLIKGAAAGQARGVFQGRITVARGADGTAARMTHRGLVLSPRAEIDAKPELEIFADDVACSHGNAIGQLDEAALFYARQRGLAEAAARALLTEAFLGEVIDRIGAEAHRDLARAWLAERLEALR